MGCYKILLYAGTPLYTSLVNVKYAIIGLSAGNPFYKKGDPQRLNVRHIYYICEDIVHTFWKKLE